MSHAKEFEISVEYDLFSSDFGQSFLTKYTINDLIYKSSNSEIYLVTSFEEEKIYTLKAIQKREGVRFHLDAILKIKHPLIAPVIEIGETERYIYVIKPFVEGITLKKHVDKYGPMSEEIVRIIVNQLMDIFSYLHSMPTSIVYRDLKPENIIVYGNFSICLIDIETIRLINTESTSDTFFIGTTGYASPEQFGFSQTDIRTDIYTIGATLFYLLTGKAPSIKVTQNDSLFDTDVNVSNQMKEMITKCMKFNPDERFQSIHILEYALNKRKRILFGAKINKRILTLLAICSAFIMVYYLGAYSNFDNKVEKMNTSVTSDITEVVTTSNIVVQDTLPNEEQTSEVEITDLKTQKSLRSYKQAQHILPSDNPNDHSLRTSNESNESSSETTNNSPASISDNVQSSDNSVKAETETTETVTVTYGNNLIKDPNNPYYIYIDVDSIGEIKRGLSLSYESGSINFKYDRSNMDAPMNQFKYIGVGVKNEPFSKDLLRRDILTSVVEGSGMQIYDPLFGFNEYYQDPEKYPAYMAVLFDENFQCVGYNYIEREEIDAIVNP